MSDSAISTREQRKLRTAEQLTSTSRRLTAEHGLNGFTVEQLCEEVGISRRTFFNYFPSKDDAVIGAEQGEDLERFAAAFLERGSRGWAAVMDDLIEIIAAQVERADINPESHAQLVAAIEREPKLLPRFLGAGRERERQVIELIAAREGVEPTDPRPEAVATVLATVLRTTGERYLDPTNTQPFASILESALSAVRTVMNDQPRKAHA
jgi:AcrR family transcriptional regulator